MDWDYVVDVVVVVWIGVIGWLALTVCHYCGGVWIWEWDFGLTEI